LDVIFKFFKADLCKKKNPEEKKSKIVNNQYENNFE
jgi:hypothetical protein